MAKQKPILNVVFVDGTSGPCTGCFPNPKKFFTLSKVPSVPGFGNETSFCCPILISLPLSSISSLYSRNEI